MTLKKLWQRAVDSAYVETFVYGRVGKHNTDTSVDYAVPGRTDYLWVTLSDRTVKAARNEAGVPQTEDLQVKLRVEHGEHVIVGRSTNSSLSVPSETPPSGVLAHATAHQHGGADEVATATPAANAIPKAGAGGDLDIGWINQADIVTDNITTSATNDFISDTELVKLAGIETAADVTDAANVGSSIDGTADLGAPADTDELAAVRGGSLGTILVSALKTALNGLYVALTGNQTVAGVKTFSSVTRTAGIATGAISLNDDEATSFTPSVNNGLLITFQSTTNDATIFAMITYRVNAAVCSPLFSGSNGSNVAFSTAALAGTTGADGSFTYSVNGGQIYMENRRGSARNLVYLILG